MRVKEEGEKKEGRGQLMSDVNVRLSLQICHEFRRTSRHSRDAEITNQVLYVALVFL